MVRIQVGIVIAISGGGSIGIGVGLMLMGIAHDLAGDYGPMRSVFGAAMVLAVLCMALLGPYVYSSSAVMLKTRS